MNKYEKWYKNITERGQARVANGYVEKHHILPRSLGGSNSKSNITMLTAREHFICHWLLIKIYPIGDEHWKMLNALRIMKAENKKHKRYSTLITARVYSNLKEEYAKEQSSRLSGKNNPMFGDKFYRSKEGFRKQREAVTGEKNGAKTPQAREKIAEMKRGTKREEFSEKWRKNISKSVSGENNGMYGKNHTEETKQKQRDKALGRVQSEETKKKKADAIRGSKREKKLCPHCEQYVAVNGYVRWHGDNCKKKYK